MITKTKTRKKKVKLYGIAMSQEICTDLGGILPIAVILPAYSILEVYLTYPALPKKNKRT